MSLFSQLEERIEDIFFEEGKIKDNDEFVSAFEDLIIRVNKTRIKSEKFITLSPFEKDGFTLIDEALNIEIFISLDNLLEYFVFYEFILINIR